MQPNKEYVSWTEIDTDIDVFEQSIKQFIHYKSNIVILGIKRGGLPTAVKLSNRLNIPISLVSFQTRDNNDKIPHFLESDMINSQTTIIIPDDIYDSGLTIETIVQTLIEQFNVELDNIIGCFHYATDKIFSSSLNHVKFAQLHKSSNWIVFPWE